MINYRKELGYSSLKEALGMKKEDKYDAHQQKLVYNVKECANNQWAWVNSYYDGDKEDSWNFFENAESVYDIIYDESGTDIFRPGFQGWGKGAEKYLSDTKFAGKKFKSIVVLYYTAKLYEEAVDEIEFDDKQQNKILDQLLSIKGSI